MKTTLEVLREGRALLVKGFTQGAFARTGKGDVIGLRCENAEKFCTVGAIYRIAAEDTRREMAVISALTMALPRGYFSLTFFNDNTTKEEVLALWDRAIAAEEAKATGCHR